VAEGDWSRLRRVLVGNLRRLDGRHYEARDAHRLFIEVKPVKERHTA